MDSVITTVVFYALLLVVGVVCGKFVKIPAPAAYIVPGLPWLGSALALGRHGTAFLAACRKQFGDVFQLKVAGQNMMFWMEPKLINFFFSAPEELITFRPAVEQFTQRVFALPSKLFFPKHSVVLQSMRKMFIPSTMEAHAASLVSAMERRLDHNLPIGKEVDLFLAVRRLIFGAGVETVFGPDCMDLGPDEDGIILSKEAKEQELELAFYAFECGFELAASPVPHGLQYTWCQARDKLLAWLKQAYEQGKLAGTPAGDLFVSSELPENLAPNLLLSVLWASQANTVAASFWAVAFLLLPENASYVQEVLSELNSLQPGSSAPASAQPAASLGARAAVRALDRRSAACRCGVEAIRLRVQSIDVRIAASAFTVDTSTGQKVSVPKGCVLAINPYLNHQDQQLFPEPHVFNPSRAPPALLDPAVIVPSPAGLAFGAGFYRCPGRFFAEMEVAVALQIILGYCDLQLCPSTPQAAAAGRARGPLHVLKQAGAKLMRGMFGEQAATWGLGTGLTFIDRDVWEAGEGQTRQQQAGSSTAAVQAPAWLLNAGDKKSLLPPPDLCRLVGVKAPSRACMVKVAKRAA